MLDPPLRCAAHPGRPAADRCPVCDRPRCGADRPMDPRRGCRVCAGRPPRSVRAGPGRLEGAVRAALAASVAGMVGGQVASEYVGAKVFSIVTPALVGVACGIAAIAAGRIRPREHGYTLLRLIAVLYAVIGTGYGFRFVVGHQDPFGPAGQVVPPYLGAALGAWLWTLPPRRRKPAAARSDAAPDPGQVQSPDGRGSRAT